MKYRFFFISLFIFFLFSCSNNKQVEPIRILQHQAIDLGDNFIGYGGFLDFHQGAIIGLDISRSMQPFFRLNQNDQSQPFFYFGHRGQGPDDFLMPLCIQYINDQTAGTLDVMSNTYYEFGIPKESEELKVNKRIKFETFLGQIIKTDFNQYIGLLRVSDEMFLLADSSGMPIKTFIEYPYQNNDERKLTKRSHAYQGTLAANPSKNKFVYSTFTGEIIHFYEIENNNIKTIAKIENKYPLYRFENEEDISSMAFSAEAIHGYVSTYATEKFVYAIYSGKTIREQMNNPKVNLEGTRLRVFDWKGNLVKEYEFDVPCSYLCVSDDDSKIWAIVSEPEIAIVSFDLENAKGNVIENNVIENKQDDEEQIRRDSLARRLIDGRIYFEIDSTQVYTSEELKDLIMSRIIRMINRHSLNINPDDIIDIQIDTLNRRQTIKAPIILKKKENRFSHDFTN